MGDEAAPPESVLGQLQRGRGLGFLRALKEPRPEARRMLTECILQDPRMDFQCESRGAYYAVLALNLELPLEPLAIHLQTRGGAHDGPWWEVKLTIETLQALTRRGSVTAADILCDYLQWGEDWADSIEDMVSSKDPNVHLKTAKAIETRFPTTEALREALDWEFLDGEKWQTLARLSPRIQEITEQPNSRSRSSGEYAAQREEAEGMCVSQLLDLARETKKVGLSRFMETAVQPGDLPFLKSQVVMDQREVAATALQGIAKLANPDLFDWLRATYTAHPNMWPPIRAAVIRAMVALPPETTLPLGQLWLNHREQHFRMMAEDILAAHACADDLPLLSTALRDALVREPDTSYRICDLAKAIGRLSDIGPVPALTQAFETVRHSCARWFLVPALRATDPEGFQQTFAFECLWDCESRVQEAGVSAVSLDNSLVQKRLQELASDPHEDEDLRDAALARIEA